MLNLFFMLLASIHCRESEENHRKDFERQIELAAVSDSGRA